jgi:hypothetical protein
MCSVRAIPGDTAVVEMLGEIFVFNLCHGAV